METVLSGFSIIFLWLVDYTIDISIFICLIFIIKLIVSKRLPAWWHYSLWLVLLVRMIIPWKFARNSEVSELIQLPIIMETLDSVILKKNGIVNGITTSASSSMSGLNVPFDKMMFFIWLAGTLLLVIYYLFKNMKFWLTIKEEPMLIDKDILELLEECKKRMEVNRVIGITVTDAVKSPALFGYIRPRLLLPEGVLEKLTYSEMTYVFMHELGHLKRHDIGVSWVVTLLQAFQWFNPFAWLAFYQMRIDQESACDASVLKRLKLDQSKDYAVSILGFLEKFCQNRQVSAMAGIMENKSQIKRRIAMIINYRKHSKKITTTAIFMLVITGFIFFTFTGFAGEEQSNIPGREINRPTPQLLPPVKPPGLGDKGNKANIVIGITKEGEIWIENQQLDIDSMVSRMERFNEEYPEGMVIITGERDTLLGTAIEVLDQVKMTGITNVVVALTKDD